MSRAKAQTEAPEPEPVLEVETDDSEWTVREALEFLAGVAGVDLWTVKQLRYTRNRDRIDFMLDDRTMVRITDLDGTPEVEGDDETETG